MTSALPGAPACGGRACGATPLSPTDQNRPARPGARRGAPNHATVLPGAGALAALEGRGGGFVAQEGGSLRDFSAFPSELLASTLTRTA